VRKNGTVARYYIHWSKRKTSGCTAKIRADDLEKVVFAQIGQMLSREDALLEAAKRAVEQTSDSLAETRRELEQVELTCRRLQREQAKLMDAISRFDIEEGSHTYSQIKRRLEDGERKMSEADSRRRVLQDTVRSAAIPDDLHERVTDMLVPLTGLHGYAPMNWPISAQQKLAWFFFGENAKGKDNRGVYVRSLKHRTLGMYWTYEAHALIGYVTGAVSRAPYLEERHHSIQAARSLQASEASALVSLGAALISQGEITYKAKPDRCIRMC
jgi:hypothetical protein